MNLKLDLCVLLIGSNTKFEHLLNFLPPNVVTSSVQTQEEAIILLQKKSFNFIGGEIKDKDYGTIIGIWPITVAVKRLNLKLV